MGNGLKTAIKELEERVGALVRLRPSHKKVLEFYGIILKEQLKAQEKIQIQTASTTDSATSQGARKLSLLQGEEPPIDLEAAKRLFQSLCRIAKKENQTLQKGIEKIQRATRGRKIDMDRFLREMMLPDSPYVRELSSLLGLDRDILLFFGRASIQPYLEKAADLLRDEVDLKEWSEGICPICGSPPLLSELAETEGRRLLICSLCGYRWHSVRMACPFCGTNDQKAHRYLFVEGDDTVRIDVCDECKKYIKTLDSRMMGGRIFPLLEYMGTLHLDILAQQEGYERGSAPFLEIG